MKASVKRSALTLNDTAVHARYCVCLHAAGIDEMRRVSLTNSAQEAVSSFLKVGPLADGSDLYIWDRETTEIVARIDWIDEPTTVGLTVRARMNRFYDPSLMEIVQRLCEQVEIRRALVNAIAV